MKSLTCISQGFDKCAKATLLNNYSCGTPPDDWFYLYEHKVIVTKSAESLKPF